MTVFVTFLLTQAGAWTESGAIQISRAALVSSLQFTVAAVSILGAHELGHYVLARRHRVSASLPYFIPLPLLGFGTLGAVIRVRDRIPTRNALVDIGASGPLAGFVVCLPFLAWGYAHSHFAPLPPTGATVLGPCPSGAWCSTAFRASTHPSTGTTSCSGCSSGRSWAPPPEWTWTRIPSSSPAGSERW